MPTREAIEVAQLNNEARSLRKVSDAKFNRRISGALIVASTAAFIVAAMAFITLSQLNSTRTQARARRDAIIALGEMLSSVKDAETGQRGYIITGDASYLEPYNNVQTVIPQRFSRLAEISPPEDQGLLDLLQADINAKMAELKQTISIRRTGGLEAARRVVLTNRGKIAMERIRRRIARMTDDQTSKFNILVVEIDNRSQRLLVSVIVLIVFEFILITVVLVLVTRDRKARLQMANTLDTQNTRLRLQRDDLRKSNEQIMFAYRRFESLFQGVPVACCCTGENGAIVEWNRASEKLFGFTREQATASTIYDTIIRPSGLEHARQLSDTVMTGQSVDGVEWICQTRNGTEIEVISNAMPLLGEDGKATGVMTATVDITERKAVERLKSEFVSTVSHELRTPLTSIRGAISLVCSGAVGVLPDQARRLCDIANTNTERLDRLIRDILDIEKIEAGKLIFQRIPCVLGEIATDAIASVQASADEAKIELVLTVDTNNSPVLGDPDRLSQVFHHLLSNAIKFSSPGGRVLVDVRSVASRVQMKVEDSGSGIPEHFRPRIFSRFAQADDANTRDKGGTGLSLNISKTIVERLGGRIWFDSDANGTTFTFDIPQDYESGPANFTLGTAKVLICGDDKDQVNAIIVMLTRKLIQVHVAYTAHDAKRMLEQDVYDLMIIDLLVPDQSGLELLAEIRSNEKAKFLPIIMVSSKIPDKHHIIEGDGVIDWTTQPLDPRHFVNTILLILSTRPEPRSEEAEEPEDTWKK